MTPAGRLFEPFVQAQRLNAAIIAFQLWDFLFSLMIPEHATLVFLAHHLLSGLTAVSTHTPHMTPYAFVYIVGYIP